LPASQPVDAESNHARAARTNGVWEQLNTFSKWCGAIRLLPVLKNPLHDKTAYHGYGFPNYIAVDGVSPRTLTRPKTSCVSWVDEAQKLAIYIIFDIVLHHAGDVFEYVVTEGDKTLKGIATDVVEGGLQPIHNILIRSYQYIIAKFDVDGYRIDILKFLSPEFERIFGNAMREFALSPGRRTSSPSGRCSTTRIRSRSSSAVMMPALASHADAGRSQRHVHSSALCVRRCQRPC
jgi:hypothetical protein